MTTSNASSVPTVSPIDDRMHPYFLHHSDIPGFVLVSELLDGDNYNSWSQSMMIALSLKNKVGFIDGSLPKPNASDSAMYNAWIRNNSLVVSWILNSVSKEISTSVMFAETATDIWNDLKDRFQQSNGPRILQIRREIVNLTQNQHSIAVYFEKLKSLSEELANLRPHCCCGKCECNGVKEFEQYFQVEHVINFLMGFNDSFSHTRGYKPRRKNDASRYRVFTATGVFTADTDLNKFIYSHRKGPNPSPIPSSQIQSFLLQLCKGVAHCHGHGVLHRGLEPQNLLVDKEKGTLKLATAPLTSCTHEIVSVWYRAPEILLGSTHYSTDVDMWSVGCIFAEMARRKALFASDSEFQQLLNIFRLLGTPTEEQWPGVTSLRDWHEYPMWGPQNLAHAVPKLEADGVDLLSQMLQYNPADRISAKAAMDHPYFESLDKSQFF